MLHGDQKVGVLRESRWAVPSPGAPDVSVRPGLPEAVHREERRAAQQQQQQHSRRRHVASQRAPHQPQPQRWPQKHGPGKTEHIKFTEYFENAIS